MVFVFLSKKYPKSLIIGIEPFKNGLANTAYYCLENKIKNIFLFPFVFQKFEKKFKDYSFDQCYIFFPDPWPKKRHHKRRLVNFEFLKSLISHCNSKGSIYFGSDNYNYFNNIKNEAKLLKKEVKISIKSFKKSPTIITKYHARALKLKNNINFLKIDKI